MMRVPLAALHARMSAANVFVRYLRQQSIIKQCPSRLSNAETNVFKMQSSDRHARSAQFCIRYILISNLITLYVVYSLCRIVQHYKHYSLAGLSKFGFPMGIVTAVPISAGTVHHERFTQTCFVSCSRRITHPRVTTHTNPIVSTVSRGVSKDIRGDGPDQHPFIGRYNLPLNSCKTYFIIAICQGSLGC